MEFTKFRPASWRVMRKIWHWKEIDMKRRWRVGIKISQWDRNSWKTKAWSLGEQVGWELWEHTTHQYFR